jgi:hypothetical protein
MKEVADRLSFFLDEFAKGYVEFRFRSGACLNLLIGKTETRRLRVSDILTSAVHQYRGVLGVDEDETRDVKDSRFKQAGMECTTFYYRSRGDQ